MILAIGGFATAGIGPSSAQPLAFIVGAFALLILLGGSLSGGWGGRSTKGLKQRRAEFGPQRRNALDESIAPPDDDALWRRERERREGRV